MNEIYYLERNKLLKNAPMHSNQQLAAPPECFCGKLLSDCKEFDPEIFFLHYITVFTRLALKDIWHFVYSFSNICRNLTALGVRNVLQNIESSIQVQFSRFLKVPSRYIHCATRKTHQNTEETLSLPYIWCKDK